MKRIVIDSSYHSRRIGLVENGELIEFIYENNQSGSLVGNIYTGRVMSVHKGMQACFIDIGHEKNGYLILEKGRNLQAHSHILVQVEKDALGTKGAVLTEKLSFPGKFIVLIPKDKGNIGISRKIDDENEKERIKEIAQSVLPKGYGMIVRTEGAGKSVSEFKEEVGKLFETAEDVMKRAEYAKAPSLLYSEENTAVKAVRDLFSFDVCEVIVNDENDFNVIKSFNKEQEEKIVFYDSPVPIFENYFIESQVQKILNKKVWLKSGGFLIIEQTEACVVIDVNTGKFTGKRDFQETVFKINHEAAKEIAKQLRLRNLSGMIIIDFIDMKDEEKRQELRNIIEKDVKKDRIKTTVVGMTELGLMQLTRKKTNLPLWAKMSEKCQCCKGNGRVESYVYISDKIRREVISVFSQTVFNQITILSDKKVLKAFAGEKNENLKEIEERFSKKIILKEIETAAHGYYEIERKSV